jgi:catechol 2,3-dioxygenase-like lactoylglutathione lyase family enzyme
VALTGLDHVQLAAPPGCEAEARRFYGGLLGLAEVEKPEALQGRGGAWFVAGTQQLHIGVEEDFAPARKAHPALRAAGDAALDALAEELVTAGVEVRWDDTIPGTRRFYCDDPWGNRLELLA